LLGLHVFEALDGCLDGFEIGQHATQPALVDIRHASPLGFLGHGFARLTLGADHQNGAAVGCQLANELGGFLEKRQGFFQVDDVDFVAMSKNEWGHLGVPEAGLVSEVDPGFQHFAHGD